MSIQHRTTVCSVPLFFFSWCRYLQLQQTYPWYSNITRRRQEIVNRVKIQPDFDKATEYFYAMLGYLDALQKIQYEIRIRIEETILSEASTDHTLFSHFFLYFAVSLVYVILAHQLDEEKIFILPW